MTYNEQIKLKVRMLHKTGCFLVKQYENYCYMRQEIREKLFLPKLDCFQYEFVNETEKADICLFSLGLQNADEELRDDEINIFISIENLAWWWFPHYYHYNKYKDFGNEKVSIYYYNHHDKVITTDQYLVIPVIYARIQYYQSLKNVIGQSFKKIPFSQKKFCLKTNRSWLNNHINTLVPKLNQLGLGKVDDISMYDNKLLKVSCYNSMELLEIYNQYKFVICLENCEGVGYITEKIFNVFFAHSIPLYWGSSAINRFINNDTFINCSQIDMINYDLIKILTNDEQKYMSFIHENKIAADYNDEHYQELWKEYILKNLKRNGHSLDECNKSTIQDE